MSPPSKVTEALPFTAPSLSVGLAASSTWVKALPAPLLSTQVDRLAVPVVAFTVAASRLPSDRPSTTPSPSESVPSSHVARPDISGGPALAGSAVRPQIVVRLLTLGSTSALASMARLGVPAATAVSSLAAAPVLSVALAALPKLATLL